jgi:hypothetical protein
MEVYTGLQCNFMQISPRRPSFSGDIISRMSHLQRKFIDTYARTGDVRAAAKSAKIRLASRYRTLPTSESYPNS